MDDQLLTQLNKDEEILEAASSAQAAEAELVVESAAPALDPEISAPEESQTGLDVEHSAQVAEAEPANEPALAPDSTTASVTEDNNDGEILEVACSIQAAKADAVDELATPSLGPETSVPEESRTGLYLERPAQVTEVALAREPAPTLDPKAASATEENNDGEILEEAYSTQAAEMEPVDVPAAPTLGPEITPALEESQVALAPELALVTTPETVAPALSPDDTQRAEIVADTLPFPHASEAPGAIAVDNEAEPAPQLRDVGATFAAWARGRANASAAWMGAHRLVLAAVTLGCMAAVLGFVLSATRIAQMPPDDLIVSDAREKLAAPTHTTSDFTSDEPLVLQSVDIVRKSQSATRDDACDIAVMATFTNKAIESTAEGTLTYVHSGDDWTCLAATTNNASHQAIAGVSHDQAIAHLDVLLQAADSDDSSESLVALYRNASVEVEADNFDESAQTDALTLHCSSPGTFVNHECRLAVHFRFAAASGAWELVEARASEGAKDLGFQPLIGTWTGTFHSQQTDNGKCLAASQNGLSVVVDEVYTADDGRTSISGTLSGVAHLHPLLQEDAPSSEGDVYLNEVPFVGTLDNAGQSTGLLFECTTQDQAGGTVALALEFGSSRAPDAATATLTSTHEYTETILFIVPYQQEARYVDTYSLVKEQ